MPTREKRTLRVSTQEKRRLILKAAVRVFAEKGFHRCRISDIADEADVAYGLVYHYFENKEEILNSIFEENWGLLTRAVETVREQPTDLKAKLTTIASAILDGYQVAPEIIQVIVMEITRSSMFLKKPKIDAFEKAFNGLAEILAHHQKTGEIIPQVDPKLLAYSFFGTIELVITGFLIGTLKPAEGEANEIFKGQLVEMFLHGICTT